MRTLKELLSIPLVVTEPANENAATEPNDVRLPPESSVRKSDANVRVRPPRPPRSGAIQHRALRPRRRS